MCSKVDIINLAKMVKMKRALVMEVVSRFNSHAAFDVYCKQYTLYSIHCTVYTIQYAIYSIHHTVYTIQYALYSIHCTVYTIQYALYTIHYSSFNQPRLP